MLQDYFRSHQRKAIQSLRFMSHPRYCLVSINSAAKTQIIEIDSLPAIITCGIASGGSCSPLYAHQWQQSVNGISWTPIPGANGSSLSIITPLAESSYFRRQVTETSSGTIAYSDIAVVFIKARGQ